jgi:hypothetical protein
MTEAKPPAAANRVTQGVSFGILLSVLEVVTDAATVDRVYAGAVALAEVALHHAKLRTVIRDRQPIIVDDQALERKATER